jgi:hypothetical protein
MVIALLYWLAGPKLSAAVDRLFNRKKTVSRM